MNTITLNLLDEVIGGADGDLEAAKAALEDGAYLARLQGRGILPADDEKATEVVEEAYEVLLDRMAR